jgi:hypothetical protein
VPILVVLVTTTKWAMAPYVLFKCQFWIFGKGQVWPPASPLPCGRDFQHVLPVALWLGSWPAPGPLPCSMACLPAVTLTREIAETHLHWGFVEITYDFCLACTCSLPVCQIKLPLKDAGHMVFCLCAFEHGMVACSVTSYISGPI